MLAAFFAVNADTLTASERRTIERFEPGVAFCGGGAQPEWSIRRLTAEE
jgi:hypothetical protein